MLPASPVSHVPESPVLKSLSSTKDQLSGTPVEGAGGSSVAVGWVLSTVAVARVGASVSKGDEDCATASERAARSPFGAGDGAPLTDPAGAIASLPLFPVVAGVDLPLTDCWVVAVGAAAWVVAVGAAGRAIVGLGAGVGVAGLVSHAASNAIETKINKDKTDLRVFNTPFMFCVPPG
jgi:hypothetical protein